MSNQHPAGCDCNEYRKARGFKCVITLRAESAARSASVRQASISEMVEQSRTRVVQAGRGKSYLG
jgi:hypothetical protein